MIALVRHGKTIYNELGKLQGKSNIPLCDDGRNDCRRLKEKIKDKHYDICFCSPLIRAVETAMILVGDKVEIRIDDRLTERYFGQLEGHIYTEYDHEKYWDYNLNCNDLEIEPIKDLFARCNSFIEYIKENYNDKDILIVTHGGVFKCIYHILNNTDLNTNLSDVKVENCEYMEINKKN